MGQYDKLFQAHLDYPREVTIETTGVCNARCVFCPHEQLERKHTKMSDELFNKIIQDLKEIPQEHMYTISPFKVNEMLMDRQIFQKIGLINEHLPNAYLRLFSNFNAATPQDFEQICLVKNLFDIDISLNSLDKKEYRELMGLDLDKTLQNILAFLKYIRKHGISMQQPKITLSRVSISVAADQQYLSSFQTTFQEYLDLVQPLVLYRAEWINHMPNQRPDNQNMQCGRWTEINICCTGVVAFCCMDGKAEYSIGSVEHNTVLEIYNQPEYRILRTENICKKEVEPCCHCSMC